MSKKLNAIVYGTRVLENPYHDNLNLVQRCLSPLAAAISTSRERAESPHRYAADYYDDNHMSAEDKTDENRFVSECNVTETLLGSAFVICQAHITYVVSNLMQLHKMIDHRSMELITTDGSKSSILRFEGQPVETSGLMQIEAVDALANYFKHHSEWPTKFMRGWVVDQRKKHVAESVDRVKRLGLCAHCSENLRIGAKMLGLGDEYDVTKLIPVLKEWHTSLVKTYRAELIGLGILDG